MPPVHEVEFGIKEGIPDENGITVETAADTKNHLEGNGNDVVGDEDDADEPEDDMIDGPDDEDLFNAEEDQSNLELEDAGLIEVNDDDDHDLDDCHTTGSMASSTRINPENDVKPHHKSSIEKETISKAGAGIMKKSSRMPAVKGLTIPFRTIKKAMKQDPDIPIVQNESAIMVTLAAELFVKRLASESYRIAKSRGRYTIRYEDIAEARTNHSALEFLEPLLP